MPVSLSQTSWQPDGGVQTQRTGLFFQALLTMAVLYILKEPASAPFLKLPFAILIVAACFFLPKPLFHPMWWATWLLYYLVLLTRDYYGMANHHFVACYLMIAALIYTASGRPNGQILNFHTRFILMAVLVVSALHKALSPSYTNGTFFQFEMYMDVFLSPMKWLIPGWETAVNENLAAYTQLKLQHPSDLPQIALKEPVKHASLIAKSYSLLAIVMEAAAGISMFVKSKSRISHTLLLCTVAGVFFFRSETGFLGLLACMGLLLAPTTAWKNIWLCCFILFAAMVATGAGLR